MKQRELTWKLFTAFLLAVASFVLVWPFAFAGFAWECIVCGFQVGQGLAEKLGAWVKEQ